MKSRYEKFLENKNVREREIFLNSIRAVKPHTQEIHELNWRGKELHEEVKKLEAQLSDVRMQLNYQEQEIEENEGHISQLETSQEQDRIRIQRLLSLCQPVTPDVTYINEALGSEALKPTQQRAGAKRIHSEQPRNLKPGVDEDPYTEDIHNIIMQNKQLEFSSLKRLAQDNIDLVLEDKKLLEVCRKQICEDIEILQKTLELRHAFVSAGLDSMLEKYLTLRVNAITAYQKSMADMETVAQERSTLLQDEDKIRVQSEVKVHLFQTSLQHDMELKVKGLRNRLDENEALLAQLEHEHRQFLKEKEEKLNKLKLRTSDMNQKINLLEKARNKFVPQLTQKFHELQHLTLDMETLLLQNIPSYTQA